MLEKIIIFLLVVMLIQLILQLYSSISYRKERTELIKMLAARNYTEYKTMDIKKEKPPPHRNMVSIQQQKMSSRERR